VIIHRCDDDTVNRVAAEINTHKAVPTCLSWHIAT